VLLLAPGIVPALGPLGALTDTDTATRVGLFVGLVVAVLAAFQMRKTARQALDRSDLLPAPPEQARDAQVPAPSARLARSYRRLGDSIELFGRAGWHVVAYGRRARDTVGRSAGSNRSTQPPENEERNQPPDAEKPSQPPENSGPGQPPENRRPNRSRNGGGRDRLAGERRRGNSADGGQRARRVNAPPGSGRNRASSGFDGRSFEQRGSAKLLAMLDEVAVTARDAYAAATGCDEETAERAVRTGEWTDDRVAAAFLATDHEAPSFTLTERALAWLTPQRTFDRRVDRTLDAVESHAEGFLTYRTPSTDWTEDGGERSSDGGDGDEGDLGTVSDGQARTVETDGGTRENTGHAGSAGESDTPGGTASERVQDRSGAASERVQDRSGTASERGQDRSGAASERGQDGSGTASERGQGGDENGSEPGQGGDGHPAGGGEGGATGEREQATTYTARFAGFVALLGVLVAVGLVTFNPVAFAAATLPLAFLLAGLVGEPNPPGDSLEVSREVTPARPRPAEEVTVTVTVENTGGSTLADLRLVDSVPDALGVVAGQPRASGPLEPGETVTVEYDLLARRGRYTFGSPVARSRTVLGSMWVEEALPTAGDTAFRCAVTAEDIPIEAEGNQFVGDLLSTTGGEGVEFYATREYRRGDPPSRVHWRELAKRGELSTITYRERRSAEITVVTDARPSARVSAGPGEPAGALLSAYATYQLLVPLVGRGHRVGVAALGMEPAATRSFPVRRIDHGRGDEQVQRALDLLGDVDSQVQDAVPSMVLRRIGAERDDEPHLTAGSPATSLLDGQAAVSVGEFTDYLAGWTGSTTQFVCVTPLLDAPVHGLCRRLEREHAPVVISPDVTVPITDQFGGDGLRPGDDPAGRVARDGVPARTLRLQRATRIDWLRQHGATVIDWHPGRALAVACENQTLPGV
jgi:uncharacterized repeat protein (TIGR01451 family)